MRDLVGEQLFERLTEGQRSHLCHRWATGVDDVGRLLELENGDPVLHAEANVVAADLRCEVVTWAMLYWADHPDCPREKALDIRKRGNRVLADLLASV